MRILITGANGFIGRALCRRISREHKVVGTDVKERNLKIDNFGWKVADLTDFKSVTDLCQESNFDVVINCAGIAHQKIGSIDFTTYMRINSEATENLARVASKRNPSVCLILLSSVSVYGENNLVESIYEEDRCLPSSDYARSKLDAERRLTALFDEGHLQNLIILRLAPVYDREWSLNLDRRVFVPGRLAYIRYGSGSQRISALARPNLVEFIEFLIHRPPRFPQIEIFNVCDAEAYEFNRIIQIFQQSTIYPNRPVFSAPSSLVWFVTRLAGIIFFDKRIWIHSCYDKLVSDLIFDNTKMMKTGFKLRHSLETIYAH